ncbi:MAG: ribose 5-phosphate isomerase B [Acholeplasmataceae bacterium]|nr:ribose 5-phosphate isomerase B [Acholeplasmataceae bacterium]
MKIAIGSDHGGFELKENIKKYFEDKNIQYHDFGTNSNDAVDYPDFANKVGHAVVEKQYDFGIVICGTGIGISIAANKVKGVRAALVYDENTGQLARQHNNANVIALGGRTTPYEKAIKILEAYMNASYEPRHEQRIKKIHNIEKE